MQACMQAVDKYSNDLAVLASGLPSTSVMKDDVHGWMTLAVNA
jgi:hypothetical protein